MKKLLPLLLLSAAILPTAHAQISTDFTFNNQPISPLCVWLLVQNNTMSGHSVRAISTFQSVASLIHSVNLSGCQLATSNGSILPNNDKARLFPEAGWYEYDFAWGNKNNFDFNLAKGAFAYRVVGRNSQGQFVLNTQDWGGGSGKTSGTILVDLNQATFYQAGAPNTLLTKTTITTLTLDGYFEKDDPQLIAQLLK